MYGKHQFSKKLVIAAALGLVALVPMHALAANKLIVNGTDGVTPQFVVTDTGWVGIGTSAPSTAILALGNSYASTQIISRYTGTDAKTAGGFIAKRNRPSINGVNSLPLAGDRVGYMLFGSVGTDNIDKNGAGFGGYAEADWTDTSFPSFFAIETAPPNSGRTEKMRITGSGNVSIGTTAPNARLEVNGGVRIYPVTANANTETPTVAATPTCDATTRGTLWFTPSGTTDVVEVCVKVNGTYGFKAVTLAP